jgi:N-acetylmuramoyl-L-alanine amidase
VSDAVVASDELNLRMGPTYDHPVFEVLVRGDELTVIGTNADDSWIEVQTATGQTGWVVTDLVNLNIDLATVPWNPNVVAPP